MCPWVIFFSPANQKIHTSEIELLFKISLNAFVPHEDYGSFHTVKKKDEKIKYHENFEGEWLWNLQKLLNKQVGRGGKQACSPSYQISAACYHAMPFLFNLKNKIQSQIHGRLGLFTLVVFSNHMVRAYHLDIFYLNVISKLTLKKYNFLFDGKNIIKLIGKANWVKLVGS